MVVYTLEQRLEILQQIKLQKIFSDEAHFDLGGYVNKDRLLKDVTWRDNSEKDIEY